jgi:hypothetical protein
MLCMVHIKLCRPNDSSAVWVQTTYHLIGMSVSEVPAFNMFLQVINTGVDVVLSL